MKIGLGTVQFGLDYGISNSQGSTPESEVADILEYAWQNGITILDTASGYGNSEEVLGRTSPANSSFDIITKTPAFPENTIDKTDAEKLIDTFRVSLNRLRQSAIYGLHFHNSGDLMKDGSQHLWEAVQSLKEDGLINKIGVSVYSPREIDILLNKYPLDLIQLPLNVFDQRMSQEGYLKHLKELEIEIHCRSVFLQGLLLMTPDKLPDYFNSIRNMMFQYCEVLQDQDISPLDAAMKFVSQQPEIDCVIVGVNNRSHLTEILNVTKNIDRLTPCIDFSTYSINEEAIINPSLWRLG